MTTVLAVGNSEETRRCDAKCHDAAGPECDCICEGRFHGSGDDAARQCADAVQNGLLGKELQASATAILELQ